LIVEPRRPSLEAGFFAAERTARRSPQGPLPRRRASAVEIDFEVDALRSTVERPDASRHPQLQRPAGAARQGDLRSPRRRDRPEAPQAESKIWHAHPVWFLDRNPVVGYSKQKPGVRLMFWSGADFAEPGLNVVGGKFKEASVFYTGVAEVKKTELHRWLKKAQTIQWDYRNIVRRKGRLERLE
jgi:hypothetical protein